MTMIEKARALRKWMQTVSSDIPEEKALLMPTAFDVWSPDEAYGRGDKRRDPADGLLYRCITPEGSQVSPNPTWLPSLSPSIWTRIADPGLEWPEWIPPQGAHNAYDKGAKVSHKGKRWISDVGNNVWEPGVYGWTIAPD